MDKKTILDSWSCVKGSVNSMDNIVDWITKLNKTTHVKIEQGSILDSDFWFYDDYNGEVVNRKRSFFSIKGMRLFVDNKFVSEQPVIIQPEVGYLGIICKMINGKLNFLMQAKIEPGNVNCVQVSPTIQATKSNFLRAHGGNLPAYFGYFENASKYEILYDQIQSEQASRFYRKRNRNIIILVDDEIEVLPNFMWMTLGQLKELMKTDNLVNMDTRTVISGIALEAFENCDNEKYQQVICALNNYRMFTEIKNIAVPLYELVDWETDYNGVRSYNDADFEVGYYKIEIDGREVRNWSQPLFKAVGSALFGLIVRKTDTWECLVKIMPEIGSFDKAEIGTAIQREASQSCDVNNTVEAEFEAALKVGRNVMLDVMMSEEGGRFYHEQNRNVIIRMDELTDIPPNYYWLDLASLRRMILSGNTVNIQLRNLVSLIPLEIIEG